MSINTAYFNQKLDGYTDLADVETLNNFFELLDDQHRTTSKHFTSSTTITPTDVTYNLAPIDGMYVPSFIPDGYTVSFVHDEYHDTNENLYIQVQGLPSKPVIGEGSVLPDQVQFAVYREVIDAYVLTLENSENRLFVEQLAHGFQTGDLIGNDGTGYVLADISDVDNYVLADGICIRKDDDTFIVVKAGVELYKTFDFFTDDTGAQLVTGNVYYMSSTVAGKVTLIEPDTSTQIKHTVIDVDTDPDSDRRLNILTNHTAYYGVQPMETYIQDANTLGGLGSEDFVQVKTETTYTDAPTIGDKLRQLDNQLSGNLVTQQRAINTGDGLTGGGDLSQDRTIDLELADNSLTKDGTGLKVNASALIDTFYPVGSIYMSVVPTNPSAFMGGTWDRFANGRTLVGVNEGDADFSTVEKTGGVKDVTLTEAQLPSHAHSVSGSVNSNGSHSHTASTSTSVSSHVHTANHNHTASSNTTGAHTHTILAEQGNFAGWRGTVAGSASGTDHNVPTTSNGSHAHTITVNTKTMNTGSTTPTASSSTTVNSGGSHTHSISLTSGTSGSGQSHENLQPYITTYMFKRTA